MLHQRLLFGARARVFRLVFARRFGRWGQHTLVVAPVAIQNPENIFLGEGVYVGMQACLAATPETGAATCRLAIGDGTKLGRFNHIYATQSVEIGRKVLTANGVYISDNLHGYSDPHAAVMDQPIVQTAPVRIGDGTWIGHNASIFGASVGRNCVVGANAVVTRDVPDHAVAVGVPARVIRRYDPNAGRWRPTNPDGAFSADQSETDIG